MEFRLSFFCLCLLICNGILGHSVEDLVDKLQNLEAKFDVLSHTVAQMTSENEDLRTRVKILEGMISKDVQSLQMSETKESLVNKTDQRNIEPETFKLDDKNRKRIVAPTDLPTGVIAFHTYLSRSSAGPLATHHILQFDGVSLNRGNGYNAFDGIFIVPTSGTYVFTWSVMAEHHGTVYTNLMKNSNVIGTTYADAYAVNVLQFSAGIVIVDVAQGDHVYVQLADTSHGRIMSFASRSTTFSGWRLG